MVTSTDGDGREVSVWEVPVPRVESVADHSGRLAMFGMLCKEPGLDKDRIMKMSLVHDLAEAITGDITPESTSGISKGSKDKMEREAMEIILNKLKVGGSGLASDEVRELWEEYEAGLTKEAVFVKDCDRLEMILQAYEYELAAKEAGSVVVLTTFFESTRGKARMEQTRGWDLEIRRRDESRGVVR